MDFRLSNIKLEVFLDVIYILILKLVLDNGKLNFIIFEFTLSYHIWNC